MGLVILDVAIGLILVYLVLSLVGSAITEMIAQKRGKRAKFLREGIASLLGARLAGYFYEHRLIRNLSQEGRDPSYIPSETFANVALDLSLSYVPKSGVEPRSGREHIAGYVKDQEAAGHEREADLGRTLLAFWDAGNGNRARVSKSIEQWFDDSMDRVSGWYRRWAQKMLFRAAVVVVLALNANTIKMARNLYTTPALRKALVAEAEARAKQTGEAAAQDVENAKKEIASVEPVLGWQLDELPPWGKLAAWFRFLLSTAIGCGITILAVSMGAGFWFKALKQVLRVRARIGAEKPPDTKTDAAAPDAAGGAAPAAAATLAFKETFDPDAARHDHGNAYWLGMAAELAYQDGPGFRTAVAAWGVKSEFVSVGDTQAHVAANQSLMIVAFRGTETNPGDIATDAKFKREPWSGPGEVHRGFREALDPAWDKLLKAVDALRQPGQTLWFTGHSLGGALAVLGGMRWTLEKKKPALSGIYTIGQPRVGDATFADEFANALGERTFRYVNNRDVVPRVPMRALGYKHAGTILYFDTAGRLHTDPGLWFKLLDTALTDPKKAKASLKETVGDHSAVEYVERLRRAAAAPGRAR